MPVFLDEIPELAPKIKRPDTRRWLGLLVILLATGTVLAFSFWSTEREGAIFWFTALGVPFCVWGTLLGIRRTAYKADQVWAESWNADRSILWNDEIVRGQRAAWVITSGVITQVGSSTDKLLTAVRTSLPVLQVQKTRSGAGPVRHSKLKGFEAESKVGEFNASIKTLIMQVMPALEKIPGNIPCWLIADFDIPLTLDAEQSALDIISSETGRSFSLFTAKGFTAFDYWLDNAWLKPSLLLCLSAVIRDTPQEGDGEAISLTLMLNRKHPGFPDAIQLHRPEKHHNGSLAKTLSRALLWSKLSPEKVQGSWVAGRKISQGGEWNTACEEHKLSVEMTEDHKNIDDYIGQVGISSPWLAVALAAPSARSGMPQIIAVETSENELWIAGVTSGDYTGKPQDAL
ncbi:MULTISPECIES: hypothetical protein [Enterobacter cloacae complex]|uniref:hypothetical protein n=1 Tax=Enterobacter cloacae complex TaxID=354276 RepID=UPI00097C511B|nr:hypothetical protein [Enterobacter chengduensis]GJL42788.1 hypothetical protein TUM17577_39970 [Enterobacter asburiae]MBT1935471.1 hypothetical protein [Enterobacter chengduensis]MBT1963945.1 hypothetical protein [Enterobacter chengduensis]MCK6820263.1 hypothetical protein [Enterobacter chengduensis]MCK7170810.1 hypothetical protein [Enterobacter chengduensis]